MIGQLPLSLEVCGNSLAIDADFRNVLRIFEAFGDEALTKEEKAYICIKRLYRKPVPPACLEEAVKKAYWFCDGGDMPKTEPEDIKTLDWNHDGNMLFPAVSKVAGTPDIRLLPFLHWWTFLGLFGEVGEGLFSTVMHIRRKKLKGQKLEKWERDFLKKNKDLVIIRAPEEQAAIDETEAFLKTIL